MVENVNSEGMTPDATATPATSARKARKVTESRPVELRKAKREAVGTVIRGYPTEVTFHEARTYKSGSYENRLRFASAYEGKAIRNEDRSAPGATCEIDGERMIEFLRFVGVPSKAVESLDATVIRPALEKYSERLSEITLRKAREVRFEFAPVVKVRKGRTPGAARPTLPAEKVALLAS